MVAEVDKTASESTFQCIFQKLTEDLLVLQKGINIEVNEKNKTMINLKGFLMGISLDLPARGFVLLQKLFNGYDSCCYCYEHGTPIERITKSGKKHTTICFPIKGNSAKYRTKMSTMFDIYNSRRGFEKGYCQFFKLNYFSPNSIVCLDMMHNTMLGIGKKLLGMLSTPSPFRISKKRIAIIENHLRDIKFPKNYRRKLNGLSNLKAMDVFLIFLYCTDFFRFVPNGFYDLAVNLRTIFKESFNTQITPSSLQIIKENCTNFVAEYQKKCGILNCTHNFHLFLHLHEDLMNFGPAWTHSMFLFEGLNHQLNMDVHTTNNFEKRLMKNYQTRGEIKLKISEKLKQKSVFYVLLKKIKDLSKKKEKTGNLGVLFGKLGKHYNTWAILKNGSLGQIEKRKDLLFFHHPTTGDARLIDESEILQPVIQTYILRNVNNKIEEEVIFEPILFISDLL